MMSALALSCDSYECTPQSCGDSQSWDRCISCLNNTCVYESRGAEGTVLAECSYESGDTGAQDECFNQMNAAGAAFCSGQAPGEADDCSGNGDCELCIFDACVWCGPTSTCSSAGEASCPETVLDDTAQCKNGFASDDCSVYAANETPPGSYFQSCQDVIVTSPFNIQASCDDGSGTYVPVDFYFGNCASSVYNDNGVLWCDAHCD